MTRCTDRVYRDEMQGPVSQTGNNKLSSFSHFYTVVQKKRVNFGGL